MAWSFIEFSATIQKTDIGRKNQILSADIEQSGRFPVVDQSQTFIAGYSNAEERVIRKDIPLVIFGDHTRCFKYVDFPFILGADGTKVLKPKEDLFDTKFFYYALLSLNIPNRGYNRHFTLLKEKKVPRPEIDEQRKIAAVLGLVQQAMEQQERLIALTTELKKTLLHQLFTQGLRGEPQKRTEIGPVPESWEVVRLGDWSHLTTKGSSPNWQGFDYQCSGVLFVRSQNVGWGIINNGFEYLPDDFNKVQARSILKQSDILINLVGASIGRVAIAPRQFEGANTNQAVGLVRINTDGFIPEYIMYFLLTIMGQKIIKGNVKEIARANISLSDINNFLVPKADINEQEEIVKNLETIDQIISLHSHKKQKLEELFRTLLHQLMTAQIRVHDIEVKELGLS